MPPVRELLQRCGAGLLGVYGSSQYGVDGMKEVEVQTVSMIVVRAGESGFLEASGGMELGAMILEDARHFKLGEEYCVEFTKD